MRRLLAALLVVGLVTWLSSGVEAQTPGEVFRKVAPSVVVIRAKGHEVATSGQTRFNETGSGVLISPDGKVMDPEDGKVYKAELWTEAAKLKVRGYLGPFYKTQTWVKGN